MKSINESGRSLIELLAVLSVMSVLAIGGIKLYNYAMDKTIAQDTFQEVRNRAIAYQERFKDHKYIFDSRPVHEETAYGYEIYAGEMDSNSKYIQIDVKDVDSNVCDRIIHRQNYMESVARVLLNDQVYPTAVSECPSPKTKMTFLFYRDIADTSSNSGLVVACTHTDDCSGCDTCDTSQGVCVADNSQCNSGLSCLKLSTDIESRCYKVADETEESDADKCGGGECWIVQDGLCLTDGSLCEMNQICKDGWCEDVE